MNESNTIPPVIPENNLSQPPQPLGANPSELLPINSLGAAIESLLKEPRRVMCQARQGAPGPLIVCLLLLVIAAMALYGLVVGSFTGGTQLWAAPLKLAGGLLFSTLICLPSLYIFSCLGGARMRLSEAAILVLSTAALFSLLLVGFAPVAWVFSQSTSSLCLMGFFHLLFGLVAAIFGFRFLLSAYQHFPNASLGGMSFWAVVFVAVNLQTTTALRPIIGKSDTWLPTEKKLFMTHWNDCVSQESNQSATVERRNDRR